MKHIGIILGSGLSDFYKNLQQPEVIYEDPKGIHNKIVFKGKIEKESIIVFSGRNHFYENKNVNKILFNIRLAIEFDVRLLIITNAAGGLNPDFAVPELMFINSYINLFFSRIINKGIMTENKSIKEKVFLSAQKAGIRLTEGTYLGNIGPTYETNAEAKFFRKIGADATGMSTIPEIIKAREKGIDIIGISCITNSLIKYRKTPVTHNEVIKAGKDSYKKFSKLILQIINDY